MKTQIEPQHNYRALLRDILIEKQKKNSKFSLRSFAKLLGVQSSFLSMVLSGKRDLSEETAARMSDKLNLSDLESKRLNLLLRLEKTFSPKHREKILQDLEVIDPTLKGRRDLAIDQFKVISDWYHLPLQLLVDLDGFEWSEVAAAKALSITIHEVREALERLTALELIEWSPGKKPKKAEGRLIVESPMKNEALKKYHTQMLEKTTVALSEQPPDVRYTATLNLGFDEAGMIAARQVLDEAIEKLCTISEKRAQSKQIFHANLNLFQLTQKLKPNSKRKA